MLIRYFLQFIIYALLLTILVMITIKYFQSYLNLEGYHIILISGIVFLTTIVSCLIYVKWIVYIPQEKMLTLKKDQELLALKKAEKYRREFFGNVSHELKTPVFNIQGYIETLIEGALYDKAVNKKYLKRTSKSVDRLIYIIQDLESLSQLDAEQIKLNIKTWNLSDLINEIIDQFEIKANKKSIQLINKESTNINVLADKNKISQVLYNLISNSIKYGKRKGKTIISCHQTKEKIIVTVADNGIGIAEKNIKRLFERFYRVDKSRSREQGGTGLGLAIVKHIIEAHNQSITVKSKIDKGTSFSFSMSNVKDAKD